MSNQNSGLPITRKEYWEIQVRNARFKRILKERQRDQLREFTDKNKECTKKIIEWLDKGQFDKVFDLLMDMNVHMTNDIQETEKAAEVNRSYANLVWVGVGDLTSKDKKFGEARTPEMKKFNTLMRSHHQMQEKQSWKEYEKFCKAYKKDK